MMEQANLHQHHHHRLQDGQLEPYSSSSSTSSLTSTAPSSYGGTTGSPHIGWTQNFHLNVNSLNPNCDNVVLNPRLKNIDPAIIPGFNSSMIRHSSPHNWHTNNIEGIFTSQQLSPHEELSETNFPKFTDMLSTSSPSTITSPGFPLNGYRQDCFGGFPGRSGSFSQIFPSINISNLKHANPHSGSFDMNSEALDLLNSTRFGGSFGQDSLGPYSALPSSLGLDQMQSSPRSPSSPSQIPSPFSSEITSEPKRSRSSGSLTESNKATQAATKKTRVESRATCPPLKVRKEKLGDRVAALQQLVAPFGKTDTASVLMEAVGYIKFLQNQVETLSVPYMKSSRNKSNRGTHMGSANIDRDDGNEDPTRDLRSRGLCLVPLSSMSYVTNIDGGNVGGGIWPLPNFGGGT